MATATICSLNSKRRLKRTKNIYNIVVQVFSRRRLTSRSTSRSGARRCSTRSTWYCPRCSLASSASSSSISRRRRARRWAGREADLLAMFDGVQNHRWRLLSLFTFAWNVRRSIHSLVGGRIWNNGSQVLTWKTVYLNEGVSKGSLPNIVKHCWQVWSETVDVTEVVSGDPRFHNRLYNHGEGPY